MKTLQYFAIAIACVCAGHLSRCQAATNDLTVSAEAQLLVETNDTRVFLTIHLLNSTDHEVTVLTRNLNAETDGAGDRTTFTVGYGNPGITHDGHPVVPSLYDFSPVTLKPNEEAFVSREIHNVGKAGAETQFVVRYSITPEWGRRFGLWSGSAESKSFTARVRKPR